MAEAQCISAVSPVMRALIGSGPRFLRIGDSGVYLPSWPVRQAGGFLMGAEDDKKATETVLAVLQDEGSVRAQWKLNWDFAQRFRASRTAESRLQDRPCE